MDWTIILLPRQVTVVAGSNPKGKIRFQGGGATFYVVSGSWTKDDHRRAGYHAMLTMQEHGLHAGQLKSVDAKGRE